MSLQHPALLESSVSLPTPWLEPGLDLSYGANLGKPRVRHLSYTLLGKQKGRVRCPRVTRLALKFSRRHPRTTIEHLLELAGYTSIEEAERDFPPGVAAICHPNRAAHPLEVLSADPKEVLRQAFLLGRCTATFYSPTRPLLWTRASLTRHLELFEPEGFYA